MGKTVLITGASRGIGAAAARIFAENGWSVGINCLSRLDAAGALAEELRSGGAECAVLQTDVSDSAQAAAMVRRAEETLGPLDALVCCAGQALPQKLITDTTDEEWNRMLAVNLSGVFYPVRAAVPGMVRRKRGAVVTVSSMWGVTGGSCESAYSASKAGVIGLTLALAKELGPSGIRVNCVAPGVIDTDMNAGLSRADLDALAEETPLCRIGTPEEAARSIFFLASGSSSFITGQILKPDGGLTL